MNFATSKEILSDNSWSVEYMKNLLGFKRNDYFQENGKEFVFFGGEYINYGDKNIWAYGDMNRFIPGADLPKEIGFFITFDDSVPGMNLDWLYKTFHLSFKDIDTDHYPFTKIPASNFILEEYNVEVMIDANPDSSVTGFKVSFTNSI